MTYIKLEDVQKITTRLLNPCKKIVQDEINSLPSINLEAMIEEMIDKHIENNWVFYQWQREALVELLQKFKS